MLKGAQMIRGEQFPIVLIPAVVQGVRETCGIKSSRDERGRCKKSSCGKPCVYWSRVFQVLIVVLIVSRNEREGCSCRSKALRNILGSFERAALSI